MRYDRMTKAELIAELFARDKRARAEESIRASERDQAVHEELRMQHAALIEVQNLLETSRDRYADLYDFAPIGYVTLSSNGVVEEMNLTAAHLLRVDRINATHLPFHVYIIKAHRRAFLDFLRSCRQDWEPRTIELDVQPADGQAFPAQLSCRRAVSEEPSGMCLRIAITDLTEVKAAEEERQEMLRHEQVTRAANEAKDRFLAMLSHELRAPLTPILYAAEALRKQTDSLGATASMVEIISRNTELEAHLIDDLLDVTRITRGKLVMDFKAVDIHEIVRRALDTYASALRAAELETVMALDAKEHHVHGDATRLQQVFWNLIRNAIKATPPKGRITLRSFNEIRGTVTVAVIDTGSGIHPNALPNIFLPFEQAGTPKHRSSGLGLGLAIAKGLLDAHGGSLRAASAGEGRGASFEVELGAMATPAAPTSEKSAPRVRPVRRSMRILVVEDHEDTAALLSMLLAQRGHQASVAHSVNEARHLAAESWDVLLTDLGLPTGTDWSSCGSCAPSTRCTRSR